VHEATCDTGFMKDSKSLWGLDLIKISVAIRPKQGSLRTCAVAIQSIQASIDLHGDMALSDKTG